MTTLTGAHLVGSVPVRDAETTFRTVAAALGDHLQRLPDGETGKRKDWIAWQYGVLAATPGLAPIPVGDRGYLRRQLVQLDGARVAPVFGPLGYADAALESFAIFDQLQRAGTIPRHLRFQVSLPTPLAPITVFVDPADRELVEPAYEARLFAEVAQIAAAIPHDRLAIQWDVAVEVALLERTWPAHFSELWRGINLRLARCAAAVPSDVALGFHLCYGDFGHVHFMNPTGAAVLAELASMLDRRLAWLHLPIPIGWTTRAAFAPLADLPETDIYLGLVHLADGLDGAHERIALASEFVPRFGIATECGWGRRPPNAVAPLLALHAELLTQNANAARSTEAFRQFS
jgi:hypothetical protein